jgi:membrane-associated phospholipid phosphatase
MPGMVDSRGGGNSPPAPVEDRNGALSAGGVTEDKALLGWFAGENLGRLAQGVSHVASPPAMALAGYLAASLATGGSSAWIWSTVHTVLAIIFPLVVLVLMVRRHEIADIEIVRRDQRHIPLMFTFIMNGFSLFTMEVGQAPHLLRRFTEASTLMLLVIIVVTRWWKISVHTGAVALTGVLVWKVTSNSLFLVAGTSIMGLSRVYLRRHTVLQVVWGAVLGFAVGLLVFLA